jgi:hypothetical protein
MNGITLWQSQAGESPCISLQYVRRQAERLNSDLQRERNRAYLGIGINALVLGLLFLAPSPEWSTARVPAAIVLLVQVVAFLLFLTCGDLVYQILRRAKLQMAAEHEQVMQSLDAYRCALERRRDHYTGAWRWSMLPAIPGVIVVLGGGWLVDERPDKLLRMSVATLVCALAFLLGAWVSLRKGDQFQREIDALKSLDEVGTQPGAGNDGRMLE